MLSSKRPMNFSSSRMNGFTFVEILIATTISLGILTVVLTLWANSRMSYRIQSFNRQIQENAQFALQIISEDLRLAGYAGENINSSTIDTTETELMIFGCGTEGWATDLSKPVFAENNGNPYSANCINADNYLPDSDVLVIRHAKSKPVSTSNIKKNYLYLHASLTQGAVFRAASKKKLNTRVMSMVNEFPAITYALSTNVYYIRRCSDPKISGRDTICDGVDDNIPTLVRLTLSKNKMHSDPLVENIENLQLLFGIDIDFDFTVDRYVEASEISLAEWEQVLSVQIFVLSRAPNPVTGYTNRNRYEFAGESITKPDGYYRKLYRETIFLRNPGLNIEIVGM